MEIVQTEEFESWLANLRDRRAAAKIAARIERLRIGNPGDVEPIGEGVSELRVHFGPGYRIYFTRKGELVRLILCGGDKSTQAADIKRAKIIARQT